MSITKTLKTPSSFYASAKPMPPCLSESLVSLWASSLSFNQAVTLCEGLKLEGKKQEKANQLIINN
jgi:hypothetical protein